MGEEV